jgi:circadian clock protein KaiC
LTQPSRVAIARLRTAVPGLDEALGGGLPEYSFNLVAGAPGTGKTTLAHQIMFANATADLPALHFTVLGEPPLKMLRYQQQFSFFDPTKLNSSIRFVNLSQQVLDHDLGTVLDAIVREVEEASPRIVVIDSFRTVEHASGGGNRGDLDLQGFLQRLSLHLTSWQATTFLVGEYLESEMRDNPVFTVADGIVWLYQSVERNSSVRKLQVLKLRGQAPLPGLHTMRITDAGVEVFPRIMKRIEAEKARHGRRLSVGSPTLDEMLGGGIPEGDSALVVGPSGSGKSVLATQFIAEGIKQGEPGVIAVFEEHPKEYLARARTLGPDLEPMVLEGRLAVIYLRPLDLSVDETLVAIQDAVRQVGAQRLAIDSLSGFELALAPTFREDFRESLYRMVGSLTGAGVTVFMSAEIVQSFDDLRLSSHLISFLADDVILQRYVELDGQLRKVLAVVKMRGSAHSKDLRLYDITETGLQVGETLGEYSGIITGVARRRADHENTRPET